LRNFFNDITVPVLANEGEIYQYAGDEVLLTWPNTPDNKVKCLKFIRNTFFLLERLGPQYEKRFSSNLNSKPEFTRVRSQQD
jgi:adenylate cyclase